jgi:hypothetical protein
MGRTSGGVAVTDAVMRLDAGEANYDRLAPTGVVTLTNGVLSVGVFRAAKTETVTQIRMLGATVAAVGATDAWLAVYEFTKNQAGVWSGALVGQSADDTTLFAAISTACTRNLTAPFNKQAGHCYGIGALVVGATTSPTVAGLVNATRLIAETQLGPPLVTAASGNAAPPAALAVPGSGSQGNFVYGALVP